MTTYYEKNREKIKQQRRERYANDITYREMQQANSRRWRIENPEKMKEHRKTWEHSNPAWIMYHNARRRAKDLDVPFDITFKDIIIPDCCPVYDRPFNSDEKEMGPSLDRIIPSLGYVKGNIRVISMRANRLKSDASVEDLQRLLKYMEN